MTKFLLSLLALMAPVALWAQTITVNGTVTDNVLGEPVMAATVVETGTSNGVVTDMDGKFTLTVGKNSTLTPSDNPLSIDNMDANMVVSSEVFTVNGVRANGLQKGVNIVRQTLSDGTVVVKKVTVK